MIDWLIDWMFGWLIDWLYRSSLFFVIFSWQNSFWFQLVSWPKTSSQSAWMLRIMRAFCGRKSLTAECGVIAWLLCEPLGFVVFVQSQFNFELKWNYPFFFHDSFFSGMDARICQGPFSQRERREWGRISVVQTAIPVSDPAARGWSHVRASLHFVLCWAHDQNVNFQNVKSKIWFFQIWIFKLWNLKFDFLNLIFSIF